ncbi:hypothetical protein [Flammeovirga sp. SJP92]|uniref:hypothetical protein n=1 Tax=Flammeovirga sp. SJP92 TaxID=1775430 RepID=UPI000788C40B|nr:hypothetical protein [Flammeovirga sp. SJP92]KXX72472.1 hypothetical protein AVL50_02395 [Flammeovirga sp. SJP92]
MSTSVELPCQKRTWYSGVIKSSNEKDVDMKMSVKFTDEYALVELMNDQLHEVYKLLPSEKTENEIVFQTDERLMKRYHNAKLVLAQKSNADQIEVSFNDFIKNYSYSNHALQVKTKV